jgi:hypothetical protein
MRTARFMATRSLALIEHPAARPPDFGLTNNTGGCGASEYRQPGRDSSDTIHYVLARRDDGKRALRKSPAIDDGDHGPTSTPRR